MSMLLTGTRGLHLCALSFLLVGVVACDGNTAIPPGTRVEAPGGAYTDLTPAELGALLERKTFTLINVHSPDEGEIEGTDLTLPYQEIAEKLAVIKFDKNAMVVVYCRSGRMSKESVESLVKLGYINVWHLTRGMNGWRETGRPLVATGQP